MSDIYILQKDLPDVKSGAELIFNDGYYEYNTDTFKGTRAYKKDEVENNPTWFQKKEQPQWEILSFKKVKDGRIVNIDEYNHSLIERFFTKKDDSVISGEWFINSVKRLIDGSIFSVGGNTNYGIINRFKHSDGIIIVYHGDGGVNILNPKLKSNPQPSEQEKDNFWTDDTVGEVVKDLLHENNQGITDIPLYVINMKKHLQSKPNWVVFTKDGFGYPIWSATDWRGDLGSNWDETVKTFSKKSDADTFILENKPCLSLNDLLSVWVEEDVITNHNYKLSPMYKRFETLASTKLNANNKGNSIYDDPAPFFADFIRKHS